jgi:hypothetical protein
MHVHRNNNLSVLEGVCLYLRDAEEHLRALQTAAAARIPHAGAKIGDSALFRKVLEQVLPGQQTVSASPVNTELREASWSGLLFHLCRELFGKLRFSLQGP